VISDKIIRNENELGIAIKSSPDKNLKFLLIFFDQNGYNQFISNPKFRKQ